MTPRSEHTLVLVETSFVVAMGGHDGSQYLSSVEYLDLEEEAQDVEKPVFETLEQSIRRETIARN